MKIFLLNGEVFQYEENDKDVINRQRILGEISWKIFHRRIQATLNVKVDKVAENRADENPKNGLIKGRFGCDFVSCFVEKAQINNQENKDDQSKTGLWKDSH